MGESTSGRRFDSDNFVPIAGFHKEEVGCPYFQVFATNLPFDPLDGDTVDAMMKLRKNQYRVPDAGLITT